MKNHKVKVSEVMPALDTEIIMASSSNASTHTRKRLSFNPYHKIFTVSFVSNDHTDNEDIHESIYDAVISYNSFNV